MFNIRESYSIPAAWNSHPNLEHPSMPCLSGKMVNSHEVFFGYYGRNLKKTCRRIISWELLRPTDFQNYSCKHQKNVKKNTSNHPAPQKRPLAIITSPRLFKSFNALRFTCKDVQFGMSGSLNPGSRVRSKIWGFPWMKQAIYINWPHVNCYDVSKWTTLQSCKESNNGTGLDYNLWRDVIPCVRWMLSKKLSSLWNAAMR